MQIINWVCLWTDTDTMTGDAELPDGNSWLPADTSVIPIQEQGPDMEQEQVLVESANTEDSL